MSEPVITETLRAGGRLLSMEEFALAIGKSVRTVSRYVNQGRLVAVTVSDMGRNIMRIPESEVAKVLAEHGGQALWGDGHDGGQLADNEDTIEDVCPPTSGMADRSSPMTATPAGYVSATDILGRYEAAIMRLGWLEGQLDSTRRMLTDGSQRQVELERQAETERFARLQAEREAAAVEEARARAEAAELRERELAAALEASRARVTELEQDAQRTWWQRMFSP